MLCSLVGLIWCHLWTLWEVSAVYYSYGISLHDEDWKVLFRRSCSLRKTKSCCSILLFISFARDWEHIKWRLRRCELVESDCDSLAYFLFHCLFCLAKLSTDHLIHLNSASKAVPIIGSSLSCLISTSWNRFSWSSANSLNSGKGASLLKCEAFFCPRKLHKYYLHTISSRNCADWNSWTLILKFQENLFLR